jgi:hypothetical protein
MAFKSGAFTRQTRSSKGKSLAKRLAVLDDEQIIALGRYRHVNVSHAVLACSIEFKYLSDEP